MQNILLIIYFTSVIISFILYLIDYYSEESVAERESFTYDRYFEFEFWTIIIIVPIVNTSFILMSCYYLIKELITKT